MAEHDDDSAGLAADEPVERLTPHELAELFLFESLNAEQMQFLADHSRVQHWSAGETIFHEGDPATCFYVLLEGTISMRRNVQGAEIEVNRSSQRGVYSGATQAYVAAERDMPYRGTLVAITDVSYLVIEADTFADAIRSWFPMAMHLLEGLFAGIRASDEIVGRREQLLALGRLSAGLTHELNNPAAAAVSATESLRERVGAMRNKLGHLAKANLDPDTLKGMMRLQESAIEAIPKAPQLTPMEAADAEDEVSDWLDRNGVTTAWDLAPILVGGGVRTDLLDNLHEVMPPDNLETGLRWLTYAVETELLMNEISDAVSRISALVHAAKQYTQVDRAAHQFVDLREGLDSTLTMLGRKISDAGVRVVTDYDPALPAVPAYAGELNQVWTNVIANAIDAMRPDGGTLTIRTRHTDTDAFVEFGDTGPGIPKALQRKIFEPFFTTKGVGGGTGLGLDISYRIIAQRHHGELTVDSQPGDTRFVVRLPRNETPELGPVPTDEVPPPE